MSLTISGRTCLYGRNSRFGDSNKITGMAYGSKIKSWFRVRRPTAPPHNGRHYSICGYLFKEMMYRKKYSHPRQGLKSHGDPGRAATVPMQFCIAQHIYRPPRFHMTMLEHHYNMLRRCTRRHLTSKQCDLWTPWCAAGLQWISTDLLQVFCWVSYLPVPRHARRALVELRAHVLAHRLHANSSIASVARARRVPRKLFKVWPETELHLFLFVLVL